MGLFNNSNTPGFTTARESEESQVFKTGRNGQTLVVDSPAVTVTSGAVDSGNTPTTTLRGGNPIAQVTSGEECTIYDPDANDGSQLPIGVLESHLNMLVGSTATDRFTSILKGGILKVAELLNYDAQALAVLVRTGFQLDSLVPNGACFGIRHRKRQLKAADYTVVAADNGDIFLATTGAVTFTLPTKANGLQFEFIQTTDANMVIASAGSADDILCDGDTGADTLTFSTGSHKIGSRVRLTCMYVDAAGTLKWFVENLGGTTMTVA